MLAGRRGGTVSQGRDLGLAWRDEVTTGKVSTMGETWVGFCGVITGACVHV